MSLLMQALKKAERAKQSHAHDEELAKPSEAFDEMLALAPQPPAPHHELTLELAALTPDPAADIGPTQSVADAAAQVPEAEPVSAFGDASQRAPRNVPPPPQAVRPAVGRPALTMPQPRTIRLLTLSGVVLLIAAVFGYIYWRAVYGPGSSRNLPMVPMPGQDIATPSVPPGADLSYPAPTPSSGATAPYPAGTGYPLASTQPANAYPPVTPAPGATATNPPAAGATAANTPSGASAIGTPPSAVVPATPSGAQPASPRGKTPAVKAAPPVPNAQEETRRIAQENLERAERMERLLEVGDPNRRRGPPPPPYVPPAEYLAANGAANAGGTSTAAPQTVPQAAYPTAAAPGAYPGTSAPSAYAGTSDGAGIRVARSSTPEHVNPALVHGYTAFNAGDFATARQQYQAVLKQDANNRDALLGIAALALHERQPEQAAALYSRLLDINPNDSDALAGLSGLHAGDPAQTEGRLRRVLATSPESPSLLFALGNLYARQGRWQEAQQQYFKAYTNAPDNPDYAFNLAVGLDRLGQGKLALGYYQRALALKPGGAVNFDRNAAAGRIRALGGQ